MIDVKIKVTDLKYLPKYGRTGDAGFDFVSTADVILYPGETKTIPTGVFVEIPEGYEIQIRPRSGKSLNTKMRVSNSPGTIDSNYRGEIMIIADNIGDTEIHIEEGSKIAQGVLSKVPIANFIIVENLNDTTRGDKGFGSSGN